MQIEPAPFGFPEVEGKRFEFLLTAEPDKTVIPFLNVRLENAFILPPGDGGSSIGSDDQVIGIAKRVRVGNFMLEDLLDTEFRGALLQNLQQPNAGNAAEAVPAGGNLSSFEKYVNIVPVAERASDGSVAFGIGLPEIIDGLIGK